VNGDFFTFLRLCDFWENIKDVELRLSPDESVYIINLTGSEASTGIVCH
jgi:hypothetical protein